MCGKNPALGRATRLQRPGHSSRPYRFDVEVWGCTKVIEASTGWTYAPNMIQRILSAIASLRLQMIATTWHEYYTPQTVTAFDGRQVKGQMMRRRVGKLVQYRSLTEREAEAAATEQAMRP